jgi:hypothetical protein
MRGGSELQKLKIESKERNQQFRRKVKKKKFFSVRGRDGTRCTGSLSALAASGVLHRKRALLLWNMGAPGSEMLAEMEDTSWPSFGGRTLAP